MDDSLATQAAVAGNHTPIPASQLKIPEDAQLPQWMLESAPEIDVAARGVPSADNIYQQALKASKLQKEATDREAQKTESAVDDQTKSLHDIVSAKMPAPVEFGKPPAQPENNPFQRFGSFASVLGIFASALTKGHIIDALDASATAMNAERKNDIDAYKQAYQQWQDKSELALKKHESDSKDLSNILDVWKTDSSLANAKLKAWAAMNGSKAAKAVADVGSAEELAKLIASQNNASMKMKLAMKTIALRNEQMDKIRAEVYEKKGKLESSNASVASDLAALGLSDISKATPEQRAKILSKAQLAMNGKSSQQTGLSKAAIAQKGQAIYGGASYSDAGLSMRAGNNPDRDAVDEWMVENHPDFDRAQAIARQAGNKANQASQGRRAGTTEQSAGELDQLIPAARDSLHKIAKTLTKYPDLNAAINSYEYRSGNPDIVEAVNNVQEVQNAYTSMLVRGGARSDAAQEKSEALIRSVFSPGQADRALDTMAANSQRIMKGIENARDGKVGSGEKANIPPPPEGFEVQ